VTRKYMIIESFSPGCKDGVYDRFHCKSRMLPEGLHYIDSWLTECGGQCYQLMETTDPSLFDLWIKNWDDLVSFQVIELGDKPEAASNA